MKSPIPLSSENLDGLWQMVRASYNGDDAPELVTQRTVVEIARGTYQIRFDQKPVESGVISQDASSRTLVLLAESGTHCGRTVRCIYQRTGDRLRICFGLNGNQPTEFTAKIGENRYLATYRKC